MSGCISERNHILNFEVSFGDRSSLIHDNRSNINVSSAAPPLNKIPILDPAPIPEKNARGTLNTRAQGQLITRKVKAVYIQCDQFLVTKEGMIAVARARSTTNGVYTREKRVIKRSIFGLLAAAFSTESL